jgi:Predicted pyridoxal phosphate-dependent enzyme apparently involved in regulation of cell wall biogenesis
MLPTNIAGAIGLAQLKKIDFLQARREEIWNTYQSELKNIDWIINPENIKSGDRHSYFTYCIKVPKRDELANYLLRNKIYTTLRYHPLHLNPIYGQTNLRLKNSEILNERGLNIPLHPRLTDAEVNKVIEKIKSFNI